MTTPSEYTAKYSEQKAALMTLAQDYINIVNNGRNEYRVKWYQTFFAACAEVKTHDGGWMTLKSFSTQDLPK